MDGRLNYRSILAEQLIVERKQFDVVCSMEVVEHVEEPQSFLTNLAALTKVPLLPLLLLTCPLTRAPDSRAGTSSSPPFRVPPWRIFSPSLLPKHRCSASFLQALIPIESLSNPQS